MSFKPRSSFALVALAVAAIAVLVARGQDLAPAFLASNNGPTPTTATFSLDVRTTASEGEILNFASGTPSDLRQGFYLQITPPNTSCYTQDSLETVHGGLLLVVAGDSSDTAFCSRTQINDGNPHAVALTYSASSAVLRVDGHEETIQLNRDRVELLVQMGKTKGSIHWAPEIPGGVSNRRILVESVYPEPVN